MKKYLAFALALIMALALIPGAALADKGGWDGGHGGGGWGSGEGGNPGGGGGNPGGQQGGYLNQERWNGNIKVVWDTFTGSGTTNPGNNGAGVTAVTLNGTAVTQQNSNTTGAASGAALSSYYSSASNQNEQSVELAITAAEGYYVSRIVVACIDPQGWSPYRCNTWSAGNAYDVRFSLAESKKETNGTFTLETNLSSKQFCHSSNSNGNHGYYILIQVAPIPQPVYVEYDYGEILNMFPGDTKLADLFNNSAMWTTVASDNAYGSGEGNFVEYTKFAYNYSQPSDIQNWKHTTNSISVTAMAAVTPKNVRFLGWEVTYYAKCTENNNELTFSEQVGTSSTVGEGQNLNVYTHAKLVAKWEIDTTPTPTPEPGKIKIKICKAIDGDGIRELPENYTIKVKVGDEEKTMSIANLMEVEFEVEVGKEYTISETYKSDIPNYDFVKATIWERNIANGFKITFDEDDDGRTIIITNKYVKHGTEINPGKLTIKKTVKGVDVPDNYEVTVNVYNADKSVNENIKLNKENSFSHTLELEEEGLYYIKETTFTDINGYQLTGMDTQEHRPYDEETGINKIFRMHVSDNSKADITIINKYERVPPKAKLTVIKKVEGLEDGVELPDDYKVTVIVGNQTITLKKGEFSKTIELDAGTYTVRETDMSNIDGYNVKTEYSNLDANNGITLAEGGKDTVTVTNTYSKKQEPKAELTIKKTVEGVDIPEGYEVTVAVNGAEHKLNKANGFRLDIEVAPGKYTIEEKGCTKINGYYCEATTITINGQTTQEIELKNMTEGHVEITNRYAEQKPQNGKLTITKSFRGVYAYDLPRSFTVYVRPINEDGMTLGSAMAVVLNRNSDNTYSATIEVGYNVYEVTEQSPYLSGYVFTGANYSAVSTGRDVAGYDLPRTNGIYVSTGENGTASVAVTNSYYYDYHDYVPVIPPAKPLPPQTGDSGTAYMGIALCVMAAAAFVAARSRKRS